MSEKCEIGLIGLAVMGQNLVRNMARNGFKVAVYNRTSAKTKAFVESVPEKGITPGYTLEEFVGLLEKPRRIMLMVQAGKAVDAVLPPDSGRGGGLRYMTWPACTSARALSTSTSTEAADTILWTARRRHITARARCTSATAPRPWCPLRWPPQRKSCYAPFCI